MAAAAAGIFHHAMTAGQSLTGKAATPVANAATGTTGSSGTNGTDSSSDNSATISANDFLTLLVTEMQNQDPTADTDPNEYINQLVQVNSLEQLIDINQTLSTDVGGTPANSDGAAQTAVASGAASTAAPLAAPAATHKAATPLSEIGNSAGGLAGSQGAKHHASGNLSVPSVNRAAQRVGHALDGRTRAQPTAKGIAGNQM